MRPTAHRGLNRYCLIASLTVRMCISTLIYIRTITTFLLVRHPGSRRIVKELGIKFLISNRHFTHYIIKSTHFNFPLSTRQDAS